MTIFSVTGGERAVTVRYLPLLTWAFGVVALYGIVDLIARLFDGRIVPSAGSLGALGLLIGFAAFVLYSGGELVIASFDRATDTIQIRQYGVTGFGSIKRRLSELVGIEVRLLRRAQHRIELRFRSGERLPLTRYYIVSWNSGGLRRLSRLMGIEPTVVQRQPPEQSGHPR